MAFKLKPPYKIDNTPIYRSGKNYNINGETKPNGSIVITDDITNPYELENTISHEKVHVDQIRRGDLYHDDKNYYWKGKKYPIKNFQTAQQRKSAPWEKEAYKKEKYKKHRK
tara:strand:- start:68 stop:403 length:336 start_codon:yes stop_codon:yes gene_type:complete